MVMEESEWEEMGDEKKEEGRLWRGGEPARDEVVRTRGNACRRRVECSKDAWQSMHKLWRMPRDADEGRKGRGNDKGLQK